MGFSTLLADTEDARERREYAGIVEQNSALLLQLISDILDLSKIEAGTMEFSYGEVNAGALCTEIVESMRLRNPQGVTLSLAEGLSECHFLGDRARITQVLTNFITNAQKFTEQGHIRLGYAVREDDTVRFYVEDTGIGIEAERQEEIFNRFIKLDSFKQGTGLGLPICKNLVERMGGSIGVDSRRGEGSCFWFTLPYRNGLLEAPEERESPPPASYLTPDD